jgi:hypothetical protein
LIEFDEASERQFQQRVAAQARSEARQQQEEREEAAEQNKHGKPPKLNVTFS